MKYLSLVCMLVLMGCSGGNSCEAPAKVSGLPNGVTKFRDGDVVCYTRYSQGISCVVHPKLAEKLGKGLNE
jgi:hypothetical protein